MPAATAPQPTTGAARPASARPAWMRNAVFRFLSSVKLAVVLISVIIVASIFGTIYESRLDAEVAQAYIYGAAWFNLWMVFLATNLAAAAFSRWPWQRRHTGFLITHLGIIILLAGALIGRIWGIEGTMTIFKGRPPANGLMINQRQLYVQETSGRQLAFPVSILGRRPTPEKPWRLGRTTSGATVELTDYAPILLPNFRPEAVPKGGRPATHVRLSSKRLNRTMEMWLLAESAENSTFDLGMASIQLRRGQAPAPAETGASQISNLKSQIAAGADADTIDEALFAFAQKSGEQIGQPVPGKAASGAKVKLTAQGARRTVQVELRGATWELDADADRGKDEELSGSGLFAQVQDYWPDFVLQDGKPATASAEPRNPAVLVRIHGRPPADDPTKAAGADPFAAAAAPPAGGAGGAENAAVLFADEAGAVTFELKSSASPTPVRGPLPLNQSINTGWADWQISIDQIVPQAVEHTVFEPQTEKPKPGAGGGMGGAAQPTDGVKVRLTRPGRPTREQWVAAGWQVTTPTTDGDAPVQLIYGWRIEPLPIGLELTDFEVERNEGTDDPAGFKSTLRLTAADGRTDTGSCWMNNPYNFPRGPLHTWTGLTYKISQANYNPNDLNQTGVQILRDPGWLLKWIGSLLVCAGIYMLFYLRPTPGAAAAAAAVTAAGGGKSKPPRATKT